MHKQQDDSRLKAKVLYTECFSNFWVFFMEINYGYSRLVHLLRGFLLPVTRLCALRSRQTNCKSQSKSLVERRFMALRAVKKLLFTIDIIPSHFFIYLSSLCCSPICWGGFLSLPLDICLFDYCAQLNIKRDLFLSFPFHFLCLFNKNVIYHVRWMKRDSGRLRQWETWKIIRAHYRQALAPPPLMPSWA